MSVWDELIAESRQLDETASQIQQGETVGLTKEDIDNLSARYHLWYGKCLSLLPEEFRQKFRTEYDGSWHSPKIKKFLSASTKPYKLRPNDKQGREIWSYWAYPYEKTFAPCILKQRQILIEIKASRPNISTPKDAFSSKKADKVTSLAQHYPYDVALSFAGEDRVHAQTLADALSSHGIRVFYDRYEKNILWGKDLYTHLSDLYQHKAQFCVVFLSQHYATKLWTNHERQAAQARAFREHGEYILPIRLDNTEIPGVLPTIGYLIWNDETPNSITDAILEKLGKPVQKGPETTSGEKKVTQELPAENDERLEEKMVRMLQFHQAITNRDWEQAERVLQKHQNLLSGRSTLGLGMSKEVQEYFSSLLYRHVHPHWPERRLTESGSLPQLMIDIQKVIQWLEEALNHQDDPEGQVSVALPLMYGFNEKYDQMMNAVGAVRTNHPALLSDLQTPNHLMMLIYACHKERSRIQALMKLLDISLPSEEEVRIAIQEPSASIQDQAIEWYAVEQYTGANTANMPVKVRIFCPHTQGTVQVTKALIFGQGPQTISRPDFSKEPDPTHPSERAFNLPVDELIQQLFDEFLFLCPCS